MQKPVVKIEKFGPRGEDDSASITVDGVEVGYIERIMTGEWASASSRQTIERCAAPRLRRTRSALICAEHYAKLMKDPDNDRRAIGNTAQQPWSKL